MTVKVRASHLLIAARAALIPQSVQSIVVSAAPHAQRHVCKSVTAFVKKLNLDLEQDVFTIVYTDGLGIVDYEERANFNDYMRTSDGKRDKEPITITNVFQLKDDKFDPLNVVELLRNQWHAAREDEEDVRGRDEGFDFEVSYWLAEFSSNHLQVMREAFWLFKIVDRDRKVKGCGQN